jgi:hypothetical protein
VPAVWSSRVFVALRQIAADLDNAAWPLHPTTNATPTVGVGDSRLTETEADEFVDVIPRVEDDAAVETTRVTGREESFLVDVYVRSSVAGVERDAALERLEQLAEIVQGMYLSFDGRLVFTPPDFPGVAHLGGLVRVTPQMWRTDAGWAGDCVVTFRINARLDQEVAS